MAAVSKCSEGHTRTIYSIDASHVHNTIATIGADDRLCIYDWDASDQLKLIQTIEKAHPLDGNSVRWQPKKGELLATGGDDGTVRLWNVHV